MATAALSTHWAPKSQIRWRAWRKRGAPRSVWLWIRHGIRIPWNTPPLPTQRRVGRRLDPAATSALDDLVADLIAQGVAQPQPPGADDRFVAPVWPEPKFTNGEPSGKFRFIWDGRELNEFVTPCPVKSEGLGDVPFMTEPGDVGIIQDLTSCYFQFAIHPEFWHFFAFEHRGTLYYLTRLPMGFRLSQMFVIKSTRWILQLLRSQGIRLMQYTDDYCLFAQPNMIRHSYLEWHGLLTDLGIPISPTKGFIDGRSRFILLGIGLDLGRREFFAPVYKLAQLRSRTLHVLTRALAHRRFVPRRALARVIGTAAALGRAIPTIGFWLASLHLALGIPPGAPLTAAWRGDTQLNTQAIRDLRSLLAIPPTATLACWEPPPATATACSDASTIGYGAHTEGLPDVSGHWTLGYTHRDIGLLEARAVRFAIRAWRSSLAGQHVMWFTDNTTVLRVLNAHSTRSATVMDEYRAMKEDLDAFCIHLQGRHIAGKDNILADALSRRQDPHEYCLALLPLCPPHWPAPDHDRFASTTSRQLTLPYDSRYADPQAANVDTMLVRWPGLSWLTPPFNLIATVLAKLRRERARAIIFVPDWPAQVWWPTLRAMTVDSVPIPDIAPFITHVANNRATPEPLRNPAWAFRLVWVDAST